MKVSYLLLGLILLNLSQTNAQSQELLGDTWYMEKVIINDEDFFIPADNIVEYAEFFENALQTQSSCNFFWSDLDYNPNDFNFSMLSFSLTLEDCLNDGIEVDEEIALFENKYLIDFINYPSPEFNNPFFYEITDESSNLKKLTITNTNGDQAVYYSQSLSIEDENELGSVNLYPNPAQNKFSIQSNVSIRKVKIYNLTGKVIATFQEETEPSTYDISVLSSGIYLVEFLSTNGKRSVKKLIKK